jgi:hypothetical protein
MHKQRYKRCNDRTITIKRDYKRHTCIEDIPSILDPDLELYYVYNDHISIHNSQHGDKWHEHVATNQGGYPTSGMSKANRTGWKAGEPEELQQHACVIDHFKIIN